MNISLLCNVGCAPKREEALDQGRIFRVMIKLFLPFFVLPVVHGQQLATPDHAIHSPPTGKQPEILQGSAVAIAGTSGGYRLTGCPGDRVGGTNAGSVKVYDSNANFIYRFLRPDTAVNDRFGARLAASGNLVAVGAPGKTVSGKSGAGVVYIYDVTAPSTPLALLAPPTPVAALNFGDSIAISGNLVVVGLPKQTVSNLSNAGSVLVYDLVNPAAPFLTLTKPTPKSGDKFGSSVAIDGRKIAIGAPNFSTTIGSTTHPNVGQAFLFNLDSLNPAQPMLTLANANTNPSLIDNDTFGSSVGISGNNVAVGALFGENGTGAVYVYDLNSASPTLPKTLRDPKNPTVANAGRFGAFLAIYGNYLAVGAPEEVLPGKAGVGAAFTFNVTQTTPYLATFDNPAVNPQNGHLGSAIAVYGNTVMTGVPQDDTEAVDAGIAYQFAVGGSTASGTFKFPSPTTADRFGTSVATAGDVIAIGAPDDPTTGEHEGSVHVYSRTGTTPSWTIYVPDADRPRSSLFGKAVAMSGNRIAVYSNYVSDIGYLLGRVYIYDTGIYKTSPLAVLNNPQPSAMAGFGFTLAMSGNRVLASVRYPGLGTGGAVVYDLSSSVTVPWATLVNPNPSTDDNFNEALAIDGDTVVIGAPGQAGGSGAFHLYNVGAQAPNRAFSTGTITNPFPAVNDRFGGTLALRGSRLCVSGAGLSAGVTTRRVYLFDLAGASPATPVLTMMNPGSSAGFGISLAFSGELLAVGVPSDLNETGSGFLYSLASPTPALPVRLLKNPTPEVSDNFTNSLGLEGDLLVSAAYQDNTIAPLKGAAYVYNLRESLHLAADPPAGGSIGGGGTFTIGSQRTISATPASGWVFTRWSDGVLTPARNIAVPADGSAFTALFRPASYLAWRGFHFTAQQNADPAFSGPDATPFNDGVSNRLKFFFNISPVTPMTAADHAALPVPHVENIGGASFLTLSFRRNGIAADLTARLEELGGTGAASWSTLTPDIVTTGIDPVTGNETVTMRVAMTGPDRRLIRLTVSSLSP